jgi:hypothetical protein
MGLFKGIEMVFPLLWINRLKTQNQKHVIQKEIDQSTRSNTYP